MNSNLRKALASTGIAGSLLLGGLGVANAQTSSTTSAAVTATTARPDRSAGLTSALAPLVSAGTITQAQSDAVVKALVAAQPVGGGGMGGRGGFGGGFGAHADTVAKALGITTAELQTQLQAGKTIAQIAAAKGVNASTIISALVAEEKVEHPDATVADLTTRVTNMVNGVRPARPAGATTPTA